MESKSNFQQVSLAINFADASHPICKPGGSIICSGTTQRCPPLTCITNSTKAEQPVGGGAELRAAGAMTVSESELEQLKKALDTMMAGKGK